MRPLLPAIRKWVLRLGAVLLLPLTIAGARLVISPGPLVLLIPGEHVVDLSPDGSTLATHDATVLDTDWGPEVGTLRLWDRRTGSPGPNLQGADDVGDRVFQFSPDGRLILAKEDPYTLKIWDVSNGALRGQLKPGMAGFHWHNLAFSPDSRFVVLERVREDPFEVQGIEFWDVDLRQARAIPPGHSAQEWMVADRRWLMQWAPDGRRFPTYCRAGSGKINRVAVQELADVDPVVRPVVEHAVSAEQAAFSPGLDAFATVDWPLGRKAEATLTLRDMNTGAVLAAGLPVDAESWLEWIGFDREHQWLTFGREEHVGDSGTITRTDCDLGLGVQTRHRLRGDMDLLSPDHRWLAETLRDAAVDVWDTSAGKKRGRLKHAEDVPQAGIRLLFSKDSRLVLVMGLYGDWSGPLARRGPVSRLWDIEAQREVFAFEDCYNAILSADGGTLVTLHNDNIVKVCDIPSDGRGLRVPVPRLYGQGKVSGRHMLLHEPWRSALVVGAMLWALLLLTGFAIRRTWRWFRAPRPAGNGEKATE